MAQGCETFYTLSRSYPLQSMFSCWLRHNYSTTTLQTVVLTGGDMDNPLGEQIFREIKPCASKSWSITNNATRGNITFSTKRRVGRFWRENQCLKHTAPQTVRSIQRNYCCQYDARATLHCEIAWGEKIDPQSGAGWCQGHETFIKGRSFQWERVGTLGRCCGHSSYMEQYRGSVSMGGKM